MRTPAGCPAAAAPRQAVVLEGIGAAFEQAGRVLAQRRMGIRPRSAEAQRVRQASGPREHSRPLRTPPSGELIRRRIRREAYRSRRAVRQQQRLDTPTRTIVCTEPPSSGRLADTGWLSSNARCTHAATVRPGAVAPWRATTLRGPHWADATQAGRILPRELGIRDAQEPQGQGGLDGEIRVAPLPTPPAAPAGRPGRDRLRGQPHRHIAASNEGLVIGRPVRNAVLRLVRGMDLPTSSL